jgi:hypothetical protein
MGQIRKRGEVWWIRYYRNGKRYEESSGSPKQKVAETLLKLREGERLPPRRATASIASNGR